MKKAINVFIISLGVILGSHASQKAAFATLGEPSESVEKDLRALSASPHAQITHNGYTVQEFASAACVVREYISPSNIVFGIAWNGFSNPDLSILLGSYVEEYRQNLNKAPHMYGRPFSQEKTGHIVVEHWGHMRDLQGRAYVPSLIPTGVTIEEIK